jgi:hypothetical protein
MSDIVIYQQLTSVANFRIADDPGTGSVTGHQRVSRY